MTQRLLEELEALREAHRTARTQDDFDALASRVQTIEVLSASASQRSKAEKAALERVKALVLEAIRAHREGRDQPANLSGTVFTLMQAVRRGTTGYER
jgi:hypothetical protein